MNSQLNKIKEMILMQGKLNDSTNGLGWELGTTNKGKIINWRRCAIFELSECLGSYPWEHWKNFNREPDYANIQIETVDTWHFIMSEALITLGATEDDMNEFLEKVKEMKHFPLACEFTEKGLTVEEEVQNIEVLMANLMTMKDGQDSVLSVINDFFNIIPQAGLTIDKLYALYVGKNVLNTFRQENGYKEGTYIKMWNGEEDNVTMQEILQQHPNDTPSEIYGRLELCYAGVKLIEESTHDTKN